MAPIVLAAVWIGLIACQQTVAPTSSKGSADQAINAQGTPLAQLKSEPAVRVRLDEGKNVVQALFYASAPLHVSVMQDQAPALAFHSPVVVVRRDRQFLVRGAGSAWMAYTGDQLRLSPAGSDAGGIQYRQRDYPGQMICQDLSGDRFDVINHLPIESYLPGVLAKELYRDWHPNAYRAQAIASRSYAIAMLERTKDKPFDLESTTASQAYIGQTQNVLAHQAVSQTRGRVLVWQGRVVTAYYSSSCGGQAQDARFAFGQPQDISPLRSRDEADRDCCAASPNRSWTLVRDRRDLALRLAAWGKANGHPVGQLVSLGNIGVTARNAAGRPIEFAVVDGSGRNYRLGPEQFRFACNYQGAGLGALPDAAELKSSLVEVQVQGSGVTITGRGYGHGVGLCQWGAQGLASRGWNAERILAYYYPGATIEKAY